MERRFNLGLEGLNYEVSAVETSRFSPISRKEEKRFHVTVLDGQDSILGKLDNRPEVTGYRFSSSRCYIDVKGVCRVEFCPEGKDVAFVFVDAQGHEEAFEVIADWIDENWDGMESVGWEVLYEMDGSR